MVFQHFSLFDAFRLLKILLWEFRQSWLKVIWPSGCGLYQAAMVCLGPQSSRRRQSVGERQRVEIVRALLQNPSLLIMDEPTSVLTQEVEQLFKTLRRLRDEDVAFYISHKLGRSASTL